MQYLIAHEFPSFLWLVPVHVPSFLFFQEALLDNHINGIWECLLQAQRKDFPSVMSPQKGDSSVIGMDSLLLLAA